MKVVYLFITVSIPDYFVAVWKETLPLYFGLKWGYEMEEGQGLVLNSNFWGMISHIKFYRKMISLSV